MVRRVSLIVGLLAVFAAAYLFFPRSASTPPAQGAKTLWIAGSDAGYVSSEVCAECHQEIWEKYRRTGMGRSFARVADAPVIEDYDGKNTYAHKASDRYYTMFRKDGKVFQRRHQIGMDGKETNAVTKEAHFVLGSGNHSRSYLHQRPDGKLVELPVGWYAEKGGYWAMNPGYDRPDQEDFRRQITYQCMFCHNGYPQIAEGADAAGTAPVFRGALPSGIDCQRCHGPGRNHVQAMRTGKTPEGTIINPARLSRERQLDLCMQCHLEITSFRLPSAIVRYERGIFSYRPGEPLADYVLHFDQGSPPANDDRFEIAHAAYRLRQSACFRKNEQGLLCTTCHNPHDIPRGEAAAKHYTAVCLSCHTGALRKKVASKEHTASQDCTGCHMPKRRTDDVVHVVMTDHFIQRRKPARDLLAPRAEKIETDGNAYKGPVDFYYPRNLQNKAQQELYLAAAQVRQSANLAQGTAQLEATISKHHPAEPDYYFELAEAYRKSGMPDKAIAMFEQVIQRKPDYLPAVRGLGATQARSGRLPQAGETLRKALSVMPDDASLLSDLGLVYIGLGKTQEAVESLQRAAILDPDYPDTYNNLGGAKLRLGDRAGAEAAYRTAIELQPDFAEARRNLANLLAGTDRFAEAQSHFQQALKSNPKYAAAHYDYGLALAQREQFRQAREQFEAAATADPGLAEAHNALGEMWGIQGDLNRAMQAYRRALTVKPEFAAAHYNLGSVLLVQGQTGDARLHLERAVALNPNLLEAHLDLGRALSLQHDVANAAVHFKIAAASQDPEIRDAANAALRGTSQR